MFIHNVFLTFTIKHSINGVHIMFYKHSITNGFCTHHFLTFAKHFLLNVCKIQKCLLATDSEIVDYKIQYCKSHKILSVDTHMWKCVALLLVLFN